MKTIMAGATKQALDFVINRFFMKIFKTGSIDTVEHCQEQYGFKS